MTLGAKIVSHIRKDHWNPPIFHDRLIKLRYVTKVSNLLSLREIKQQNNIYQHWHCQKVPSRCSPFQMCHTACWLFGNVATWQLHNPPASPGATDLMTYSCSWQGRWCLLLQILSSRSGSGSPEKTYKKG